MRLINLRIGGRCKAMMVGGWWFMELLPMVVWALLASGRAWGAWQDQDAKQRSPQILEERFARGAIDREEFKRRRNSLSRR